MHALRLLSLALAMIQAPFVVTDDAKMFSEASVRKANESLVDIWRETRWEAAITTVDSLNGKSISDEAHRLAEESNVRGLFVLIAKKESKLFAVPSAPKLFVAPTSEAKGPFTKEKSEAVIQAFMSNFKKKQYDQGLAAAVEEIRKIAVSNRTTQEAVGVRDDAKMFSSQAVTKADEILLTLNQNANRQVLIQTIDSLNGQDAKTKAESLARSANLRGLLILIAKNEKKIYVLPSKKAEEVFTREKQNALIATLENGFRAKTFDKALVETAEQARSFAGLTTALIAPVPAISKPKLDLGPKAAGSIDMSKKAETTQLKPTAPATTATPRVAPEVASQPGPRDPGRIEGDAPVAKEEAAKPNYIVFVFIGVGAILILMLLSRMFRKAPAATNSVTYNMSQPPQASPGYGPQVRPAAPPGYGPQPPPGYGPQPPPGYGPGGYAPPQQGGGGGFLSGALGGLGGAVVGNILYDRFGRPHPEGHVETHNPSSAFPGSAPSAGVPSRDSIDPNSGVEGSWAEPAGPTPAANEWVGNSGDNADWGTPQAPQVQEGSAGSREEPAADPGAGGDWNSAAPEEAASPDWASPPEDDSGAAGGDWGGDAAPPDQGEEGGW
jgi:uncharacterized membrane protein YgcG